MPLPDGDDTSDVSVQVRDSDGALSNIASQTVAIANVAPHISLTGPDTADEGQSKTYAILVTDPGDDTHTITRSCGAHGVEVSFTYDQLTHIGSLVCNFPDGPTTTEVTATVKDSDDATDADAQLVTVTVSNVPPVITPPAAQTADEGVSKLFDLGSFPQPAPTARGRSASTGVTPRPTPSSARPARARSPTTAIPTPTTARTR